MPRIGHDIQQALAAQTLAAPYTADAGSGGGSVLSASFLTLAADPLLTSERVLTPGSGLGGVDSGAGAAYTLSVDATVARNTWAVAAGAGLTGGGNLAAAGITLDVGAGSGISVAANSVAVDQSFAFAWTGLQSWSQLAVFNAGARVAAGQALQFGTDVALDRKGADVLELGVGDSFQARAYTSGLAGWHLGADGNAEFENVRVRGELSASVFRISEITATAGTQGVFKSAATLYSDYTAPGSIGASNTLTARNSLDSASLLAAADRIRIKAWDGAAIRDLWLSVTTVGANSGDHTDYTVKLESGSTGVTIAAGTAIADYGPSGSGFITLSADGTIGSSANISIADHAGSPWTTTTLRARLGNLNGSYGIATDLYGFGVGDYAGGNYLRYAPDASEFVIQAKNGGINIDSNGIMITAAGTGVMFWRLGGDDVAGISAQNSGAFAGITLQAQGGTTTTTGGAQMEAVSKNTLADVLFTLFALNTGHSYGNLWSVGTFDGVVIGANATPGAMLDVRGTGLFTNTSASSALTVNTSDAGTANVPNVLQLGHNSSGTPAVGFGQATLYNLDDSTTPNQIAAYDQLYWVTATHASRKARRTWYVYDTAQREFMRAEASGSAPMIGFLGAAAVVRQSVAAAAAAGGTGATAGAYDTAAHRDALITLVNNMRTAGINLGLWA